MSQRAFIMGAAALNLNPQPAVTPLELLSQAVHAALRDADIRLGDVTGLLASPCLAPGLPFMPAHQLATHLGLLPVKQALHSHNTGAYQPGQAPEPFPSRSLHVLTLDTGGASPISALAMARRMIQSDGHSVVVVAAADSVASLPRHHFLALADASMLTSGPAPPLTGKTSSAAPDQQQQQRHQHQLLPSPVIPHAYDVVARWQMAADPRLTRRHLAMCASLMTLQASRHPNALAKHPLTVDQVLSSPSVAPCTSVAECARRADGAAAVIVVSEAYLEHLLERQQREHQLRQQHHPQQQEHRQQQPAASVAVEVLGTGEASGPCFPPAMSEIHADTFASSRHAVRLAANDAGLDYKKLPQQIDYFGLYDCFPICLLRAIEAVGLAPQGEAGLFIERMYTLLEPHITGGSQPPVCPTRQDAADRVTTGNIGHSSLRQSQHGSCLMNINTHGGLMGQGAPWEAPAMYSLVEAVEQLRGQALGRQVPAAKTALVYGNGGVFSASAVAILGRTEWPLKRAGHDAALLPNPKNMQHQQQRQSFPPSVSKL